MDDTLKAIMARFDGDAAFSSRLRQLRRCVLEEIMGQDRLTDIADAEVLTVTVQRLVAWGASEREARALANVITLERDTSDATVEQAVIKALVRVKQAVDGVADIEYIGGIRRDTLRVEGRQSNLEDQ